MQEDGWLAKAKILASLNHPNIMKFICCNKYETEYSWGHFIAMEQMETSLGSFIRKLRVYIICLYSCYGFSSETLQYS